MAHKGWPATLAQGWRLPLCHLQHVHLQRAHIPPIVYIEPKVSVCAFLSNLLAVPGLDTR
jgi:hypothetical protein